MAAGRNMKDIVIQVIAERPDFIGGHVPTLSCGDAGTDG
jgi:hypothetical protein